MKILESICSNFKFLVALFLAKTIYKHLNNKNLWLIGEKKTEARDNGYHFFKYVRENYPEINAFYVLTKDSSDLKKIIKYGNLIYYSSIKHYIYMLTAKKNINSQPPNNDNVVQLYRFLNKRLPFLINENQQTVFLQHGITKDKLSEKFNYEKTHYSIFACSAERERDFIIETFGYPRNNALVLGLCRFDKLFNSGNIKKRQILLMPTFRSWLVASNRTKDATPSEQRRFKESSFYKTYIDLLNSQKLVKLLKKYDYDLVFYPHYSIQSYIKTFKNDVRNKRVIIANRFEYDVQDLLLNSTILITDYSSVFFDFAYMKKPEIFFQFDKEEYRNKHYATGYFSYEEDGFGPVVENINNLLTQMEKTIKNNSKVDERYLKRIDDFFTVRDANNCKRTFDAINCIESN